MRGEVTAKHGKRVTAKVRPHHFLQTIILPPVIRSSARPINFTESQGALTRRFAGWRVRQDREF
jgi:hypothetical protein